MRTARLADLAADLALRNGCAAPTFPASLLLRERRYFAALAAGDQEQTAQLRAELIGAIETLRAQDDARMAGLDPHSRGWAEGDFLRTRLAVLSTRLDALGPGCEVALPEPVEAEVRSREAAGPQHRNDIQGLRAIAVLLVALAHAGIGVLAGGFVGVDVFFVLSGFLITGLLVSEARRRRWVSLAEFYLRRARRILPAATLTLLVTDLAAYHLLNFVRAKQYAQDSLASVLFAANVHFAAQGTNYFAQGQPPSPVQHFWSLAVEEQFYVVWPLLFMLVAGLALRRHAPRPREVGGRALRRLLWVVGLIAVASLAWSIHETAVAPAGAYFSTFTRGWELALGAGLAIGGRRLLGMTPRWRLALGWAGLAAIAGAAVVYSSATPFPGYAALLPTLGAAAVIAAGLGVGTPRATAGRLLAVAPLRYIGDRSYAFYLWHWPVLVIAAQRAGRQLSVQTNLLLLLGAFALSVVSYRLVEQPVRIAAWARRPQALVAFASAVIAVVVVATAITSSIENREASEAIAAAPVTSLALPQVGKGPTIAHASNADGVAGSVLPAVIRQVNSVSPQHSLPSDLSPPIGQLLNDVAAIPSGCEAGGSQLTERICRLGASSSSSSRALVVVGDSHAEMWLPAIERFAATDGWAVIPIMKSGCSPSKWLSRSDPEQCSAWFRWAMREVLALRPAVSLLAGFYSELNLSQDGPLLSGISSAITTLRRASKNVIVVGDVPIRTRQPVDCLLVPHATVLSCADSISPNEAQLDSTMTYLASVSHVGYIDPTGWFCYQAECPLIIGNMIAYRDETHISSTYAAALSGAFRAAFQSALKVPGPRGLLPAKRSRT